MRNMEKFHSGLLGDPGSNPTKISRATGRVLYARIYDEETTYGNVGGGGVKIKKTFHRSIWMKVCIALAESMFNKRVGAIFSGYRL